MSGLEMVLTIVLLKQVIIGSEFDLIKWMKNKKDYWSKYNEWLRQKP